MGSVTSGPPLVTARSTPEDSALRTDWLRKQGGPGGVVSRCWDTEQCSSERLQIRLLCVDNRATVRGSGCVVSGGESASARFKLILLVRELEFHTFALQSERMKGFLIHGLAEGFSAEEVEEELKAALPAVVRVVQMEKREGGKKEKSQVEKYRSGDTPPQCFRCQRYGPTSRYCNLKEVCAKCSGNHHTKDCKKGAQVKCANCQKAHVASYRQCETRIAFLEKRSSAPIGQHTSAGPVTQRRQWSAARPVATNYSFSQALGNQQGSVQIGSNICTRQTGTNTASDFNARHRLWGCQKNKSGGVLYDFVMDRRAALVAPSNPTCIPCNGGTPSTLDLVLTNRHKCITEMRTVTEGGSDHLPVLFNIWGRAEANVKRPIFNFGQTDWDLFRWSLDLNIPTASPLLDTQSYLSDRNIRVRIGESLSEEVSLQAGLPQGSVLSPWLFNIYTAHVLRNTTSGVCISGFADDTALYTSRAINRLTNATHHIIHTLNQYKINVRSTAADPEISRVVSSKPFDAMVVHQK
ncbi:hypothetical protein AAG570_010822 [Ranatra chinensis]|uniref:Reverse transcriptase domain-containing protein n=1 Tax=Ranatra chinensis TaxID=642074 RepID=A0ABD0Z760_9HEMI